MEAAGLRADQRDYCAHHLIDFYKCREQNFPWVAACGDIKHHWDACQFDEWVVKCQKGTQTYTGLRDRSENINGGFSIFTGKIWACPLRIDNLGASPSGNWQNLGPPKEWQNLGTPPPTYIYIKKLITPLYVLSNFCKLC